ncbi:MAG: TetR/AcrR family transcriptional regulator [Salaquimonas sp.]|nr:TetR/AcrR family transcriptional regulator [Salaquimonas sp.]
MIQGSVETIEARRETTRLTHQAAKSDAMRAAILDAAVNRLSSTGYHASSIKKIAAEGDFSIGALQHHFPSKEDLMVAVAERGLKRGEIFLTRWAEERGAAGLPELIDDSWSSHITSHWYKAMLEIFVAARTDERLCERLAPAIAAYSREAEGRVAALATRDGTDTERLKFLITASRCMLGGFLVQDALAMSKAEIADFIARWGEFLKAELDRSGAKARPA